jgi:uncharacterized membrane protein
MLNRLSRPENAFALISLAFGLAMLILNPPLRAPDEGGHFARAYQMAEGILSGEPVAGTYVVPMRPDVGADFEHWNAVRAERDKRDSPAAVIAGLQTLPVAGDLVPTPLVQTQAIVFPGAYWPQAIGIRLGLLFHESFLALMYTGRAANLVICTALTMLAIRFMPCGKWCLVVPALLPMAVFERASLSTDGITMAGAALALAALLRLAVERDAPRLPMALAAGLGLLLLAAAKAAYLCVFLLWLPVLRRDRAAWIYGAAIALPAAILTLYWGHFLGTHQFHEAGMGPGILDPGAKAALAHAHPGLVLLKIVRTFLTHAPGLAAGMIGAFGYVDVYMPALFYPLALLWLLAVAGTAPPCFDKPVAGVLALVFLMQLFLVAFGIFMIWSDPASPIVLGIQGRYFLPLLPCLLLGAAGFVPPRLRGVMSVNRKLWIAIGPALILLLTACVTLYGREWI